MKKRNKLWVGFLILSLCLCLLPFSAQAAEAEETTSPGSARIEISSPQEWREFVQNCRLDTWSQGKTVVLTEDISLFGWDCVPVPSFGGFFQGGGHTISGLLISSSAAPTGLFSETQEGAEIHDLHVIGTVAPSGDGSTVGGLVGRNQGLLQDCSFQGSVVGRSRSGGLVGLNTVSGVIENCRTNGTVSGKSMTGGLVGRNDGAIRSCRNSGSVNLESSDPHLDLDAFNLRGFLSSAEDASLTMVNVSTDTGGVCGYSAGTIAGCINYGTIGYPHVGYNVGGIVGRNVGFLDSCQNYGPIQGRRDIGGVAGQMEPYIELVLSEDMAQRLQQQMNSLSYCLNQTAEDARGSADDAAARLEQIAQSLLPLVDAVNIQDPEAAAQQLGALIGSFSGISGQLDGISAGIRQSGETLIADMEQVVYQMNAVNATLSQAINAAGSSRPADVLSDTSEENVDAVTVGKAFNCRNIGAVAGDINVGGIAGSMSVEVELDPEGDLGSGSSSLLRREYQMKSILQRCTNLGTVTARKNCAGSVCGMMELGLVYGCCGYGTVESESGDYVGGIVGLTQAVVRDSWAKCSLRGGSYVGGVVGSGARSETTGAASMVAGCRSMVEIPRASQYTGAVAGGEDGQFSGNLFVSDDLTGVNRMNRSGQAEPISYTDMIALEGAPSAFHTFTLDFRLDGESLYSRFFSYGASFSRDIYPSLPPREGYYGSWDVKELKDLRFDTVVNAVYLPAVTALRSQEERADGKPVFFVEGAFREEDILKASQTAPETLESIIGRTENGFLSGLQGQFSRRESVYEQWELRVPSDGAESHVIRFVPPEEDASQWEVYEKTDSGWRKADCGRFGSYLTFPVVGPQAELAVVQTSVTWQRIAVFALAVVLLAAALWAALRAIVKKRRHPQS